MADFLVGELEALGVSVTKVDLGKHLLDGAELQLPPALLGKLGDDPKKKTILLYAHYDVQPVRIVTPPRICILRFRFADREPFANKRHFYPMVCLTLLRPRCMTTF
jgi:hypothetical protein